MGNKQGLGIQHWADNNIYIGEWNQGKANGCGWLLVKDSEKDTYMQYYGEFKDNSTNGYGIVKHQDCFIKGLFVNDTLENLGVEYWMDDKISKY